MGHRLTPSEEAQQLRQATREAHEAMQGLYDAIRTAEKLTPQLTADYQAHHERELKQVANALSIEQNNAARDLNASIERARLLIREQIMAGKAVFDVTTQTVTITFGDGGFDDHQPPPYPEVTPKETTQ
jgi:F0F1-type ATP synthase membrane subunit b/b'